jgi:hypothetical protein
MGHNQPENGLEVEVIDLIMGVFSPRVDGSERRQCATPHKPNGLMEVIPSAVERRHPSNFSARERIHID